MRRELPARTGLLYGASAMCDASSFSLQPVETVRVWVSSLTRRGRV